jgi:hypothetical protein
MGWRVAGSILQLHEQLQEAAPAAAPTTKGGRVDPNEWGTVSDAAHSSTSDHTPHDFPGWGTQIVTAGDFPNRPDLGLDAHRVLDDIRRSRDERVKYGISNDQMFSSYPTSAYPAWTWRPYNPTDPRRDKHLTHGHLSVVGDARADGTQPWKCLGGLAQAIDGDDEMGASFGPVQILPTGSGPTSLAIPPVQAGLADPRKVWLNIGADMNGGKAAVRIWASNGGKPASWHAVGGGQGLHVIESGEIYSIELDKGDRLLSVTRWGIDAKGNPIAPDEAGATVYGGSLSACFERM